ncbi:hypothetical protein pb186bvf_013827 [Paramecium bursaria]
MVTNNPNPTIVIFQAEWCGPCKKAIEALEQQLEMQYKKQDNDDQDKKPKIIIAKPIDLMKEYAVKIFFLFLERRNPFNSFIQERRYNPKNIEDLFIENQIFFLLFHFYHFYGITHNLQKQNQILFVSQSHFLWNYTQYAPVNKIRFYKKKQINKIQMQHQDNHLIGTVLFLRMPSQLLLTFMPIGAHHAKNQSQFLNNRQQLIMEKVGGISGTYAAQGIPSVYLFKGGKQDDHFLGSRQISSKSNSMIIFILKKTQFNTLQLIKLQKEQNLFEKNILQTNLQTPPSQKILKLTKIKKYSKLILSNKLLDYIGSLEYFLIKKYRKLLVCRTIIILQNYQLIKIKIYIFMKFFMKNINEQQNLHTLIFLFFLKATRESNHEQVLISMLIINQYKSSAYFDSNVILDYQYQFLDRLFSLTTFHSLIEFLNQCSFLFFTHVLRVHQKNFNNYQCNHINYIHSFKVHIHGQLEKQNQTMNSYDQIKEIFHFLNIDASIEEIEALNELLQHKNETINYDMLLKIFEPEDVLHQYKELVQSFYQLAKEKNKISIDELENYLRVYDKKYKNNTTQVITYIKQSKYCKHNMLDYERFLKDEFRIKQ